MNICLKWFLILGVAIFAVLLISKTKGFSFGFPSLPPHEFAYGMPLKNIEDLPVIVNDFLSLEAIDPEKIRLEVYVGNSMAGDLQLLINYLNDLKKPGMESITASLRKINKISDPKEKITRLISELISNKEALKDENKQDYAIIFIKYSLKNPQKLSEGVKKQIDPVIIKYDTPEQVSKFNKKCPADYLEGNINIYPLAIENTFWHKTIKFDGPQNASILEIRFMGLNGIFRYLLERVEIKQGIKFVHVDGESL